MPNLWRRACTPVSAVGSSPGKSRTSRLLAAIVLLAALPAWGDTQVRLDAVAAGRYLYDPAGVSFADFYFYMGQGQAGYVSFDIAPLAGMQVLEARFRFIPFNVTNEDAFPLLIGVQDVFTGFDSLARLRGPLDGEGITVLLDLIEGTYAYFLATIDASGYDVPLGGPSTADLQAAVDAGLGYFSLGLANPSFYAAGYLSGMDLALEVTVAGTTVNVDLLPGAVENPLNPRSSGLVPVAVLTEAGFDATSVDGESVRFGPAGATEVHGAGHLEDVDLDGDVDLLLHFSLAEAGIRCGDAEAGLSGITFDGQAVMGSDAVSTVGCGSIHP